MAEAVTGSADGAADYYTVRDAVGVLIRDDLVQIRVSGRDPVRMMNGLVTNDLALLSDTRAVYAAILTPKGRIVSDLRIMRAEVGSSDLIVDLPALARDGVLAHLKKYVPPMYARAEENPTRAVGVYGPLAADLLARLFGERPGPEEDRIWRGGFEGQPVIVIGTGIAGGVSGYDVVVAADLTEELEGRLVREAATLGGGAVPPGALEVLRVESGRPAFGAEVTEEMLPGEVYESTGLLSRAVSFTKGCYTGQEVVIRIAHRGHVNRHLRGLLLGDAPVPETRTPLHDPATGKEVGWTTSAARSPALGQVITLGYVRREVGIGGEVRLGGPDGRAATVVDLPFTSD